MRKKIELTARPSRTGVKPGIRERTCRSIF